MSSEIGMTPGDTCDEDELSELSADDEAPVSSALPLVSSSSSSANELATSSANEIAALLPRSAATVPVCDDSFILIVPRTGVPAEPNWLVKTLPLALLPTAAAERDALTDSPPPSLPEQ